MRPVVHGSVASAELDSLGLKLGDAVDFSVNTNPLGLAPNVRGAIETTDWTRYPGDDETPLRRGLAERNQVADAQVALGNGAAELLWLIALALLRPGDQVAVVGPTFGEYARAALAVGAEPVVTAMLEDVPAARAVFVCNPNNPTASYLECPRLESFLVERPDRLLVLDEAYASFAPRRWPSVPLLERFENLVILRSLTKDHALPGLRLGYALAPANLAHALEAVRPPWSVNSGALRAGLATLEPEAEAHLAQAMRIVATSRTLLTDGFSALGYHVAPSSANFVLVDVRDALAFRSALMRCGMVVRDCTSFGLPAHVRIACRLPNQCRRLIATVRQLQAEGLLP
jgi:histidinol-phosphate aminotransferase